VESECLEMELIQNDELVAAVRAEISSLGLLLICDGCDDLEALIAGFLASEQNEQAWPLCRSCIRKLSPYQDVM